MFTTTMPHLSKVTIKIIGRVPHLTLERRLDQLHNIHQQPWNLMKCVEQINDIPNGVQYNKARPVNFAATMRHPDTSQPADAIDQFDTIIQRINNAMRTLDQLIVRTHKLSTETSSIPTPSHKYS